MFKDEIKTSQLDSYVALCRYYVKKWNENKIIKKINFNLEKHISNYSISEIIDMSPLSYEPDNYDYSNLNARTIMRQILHFAMGYFTISTEYRLIA
jgi:hypothetical protein